MDVGRRGKLFNIQKFSIHDGPGIRTTVFFAGCPLRCGWCSNPESQSRYAALAGAIDDAAYRGREYTAEEVMAVVRQDEAFYRQSGGGMTLSGGEVLLQADFAMELADAARSEGIHTAAETTGYAAPELFREFMERVDLLLFDFKHWDGEVHAKRTGVSNDVILENLARAAASRPVIARIPVIPGFNREQATAERMAGLLSELGVKRVDLLPFHQFGESKYARLGVPYEMAGVRQLRPEELEEYRGAFLARGLDCRLQ